VVTTGRGLCGKVKSKKLGQIKTEGEEDRLYKVSLKKTKKISKKEVAGGIVFSTNNRLLLTRSGD